MGSMLFPSGSVWAIASCETMTPWLPLLVSYWVDVLLSHHIKLIHGGVGDVLISIIFDPHGLFGVIGHHFAPWTLHVCDPAREFSSSSTFYYTPCMPSMLNTRVWPSLYTRYMSVACHIILGGILLNTVSSISSPPNTMGVSARAWRIRRP